ncbi:hypothetical protein [Pseudoalteromonas umbrosa]|uniref:hypothetical protein n=1 Tax=Pseudoalteromonas umbrosa TaxID=3048489 RepID=UPI0024C424F7|nr:hypothetical protein [Pseudoalteromonas sp. B95]MDK1287758.1 hypothetical protein [Pseudoalteromonas sp. B95]
MKLSKNLLLIAALSLSSIAHAGSQFGVDIITEINPSLPDRKSTYVTITDRYSQNPDARFSFDILYDGVNVRWTDNNRDQGRCTIFHDVDRDNSTRPEDQLSKRLYNKTKLVLSNLQIGDTLIFRQLVSDTQPTCFITFKRSYGQ